jgi:hypothetical protein
MRPSRPPFPSKADFLARGLEDPALNEPQDCSICREPLAIANKSGDSQVKSELPHVSTETDTKSLENPTRIIHCGHIFGHTCLNTWFANSPSSNRCPECNVVFFGKPFIHLGLRYPSRTFRRRFADYVEIRLGDEHTAAFIRHNLMHQCTTDLIQIMNVEMFIQAGFEVTWEWVNEDEDEESDDDEEESEDESSEEEESEEDEFGTSDKGTSTNNENECDDDDN